MNENEAKMRNGLKDIWNAFMCKGVVWAKYDIPVCPTTADAVPSNIITWTEAKSIYKKHIKTNRSFAYDAFVCFYEDDYKFDGPRSGVWVDSENAFRILSHFSGIITPDFSTYQDFPEPLKLYNTFRMRAFGYWAGKQGIKVINNVRWGTEESFRYCFQGIDVDSIVCIGTVGGNPSKIIDRRRFESGLNEMIRQISPKIIVVYGSANYPCIEKLGNSGISIVAFQGSTARAFERRCKK